MKKTSYFTPDIRVINVNPCNVLCLSEGDDTEQFTISSYSYGESDWE